MGKFRDEVNDKVHQAIRCVDMTSFTRMLVWRCLKLEESFWNSCKEDIGIRITGTVQ